MPMSEDIIKWKQEPYSITNGTKDGYLWFTGTVDGKDLFEIRFKYDGIDRWTLIHLPSNSHWTKDGTTEEDRCKILAEEFLRSNPISTESS